MVMIVSFLLVKSFVLGPQGQGLEVFAPAKTVIQAMGVGFNLGNTFDLKANSATFADAKKVIDLYRSAGAKHIRIPITWMDMFEGDNLADEKGNLKKSHPRLAELRKIVGYCTTKNLYVILNTHHEHWLKKSYDGSAKFDSAFSNLWTGIANQFENSSSHVVFEVLNEPEGKMGDWSGPVKPFDQQAIALTRRINEIGYAAIRKTGGNNTKRTVLIMPNGQGNHNMLQPDYPDRSFLPGKGKDPFLGVSVHTYDPWPFCGQDGSNAKWPGEAAIVEPIQKVIRHAQSLGVGIHYGEFGVGRDKDQSLRNSPEAKAFYQAVKKTVVGAGGSVTPWDDRGWFGLIQPSGSGYQFKFNLFPEMVSAK